MVTMVPASKHEDGIEDGHRKDNDRASTLKLPDHSQHSWMKKLCRKSSLLQTEMGMDVAHLESILSTNLQEC